MSSDATAADRSDLTHLVARAAGEAPDRLAVVEPGGRGRTWAELDDEVSRVAHGLVDAGVLAGQRVLFALGNRLEFVTTYLGVLRAQAVAVPVNPGSTVGELARMIADSGSRLVVADASTVEPVRAAAALLRRALGQTPEGAQEPADRDSAAGDRLDPDLLRRAVPPRVVVVDVEPEADERTYRQLCEAPAARLPLLPDPEKLAALLYTSGASGRPRAAMLSHRALLANIEQVAEVRPPMIHGDDVVLGVLPLFHVYGLNAVLGGVLRHRAKLVLVDRFHPHDVLDLIEDEACSVLPVAPPVFGYWRAEPDLADRLGPVRLVLSGSAPLAAELVEEFTARTGLPVHQGYGLTEAAPVVTSTLCSADPRPGSVGSALPGIDIRLVDDSGRPPEGEDPGEIWIRGANLFGGYWPDGAGAPDDEGWWATGDVGFLDASGDLTLVDRLKDLVVVSGFNVYPVEVEDVIAEVPGVAGVAVIGVHDAETGEAVVAYVRGAGPGSPEELAEAVRAHCATRLARFKWPSRIEVVDELPMTATGKVQKGRLRGIERRRSLGLLEAGPEAGPGADTDAGPA
ncbi:class I adenylate-forming enzyme family protein [Nocardioides ferulae]|uniref:class I adenylate-forming enzyme family protein n=1 Tax=Nocardioides ferulae TaxID=2340821 RepID=UPI000EB3078E|nr:class I adenylate-forming enzyme family protein [Nocardioides ferulae]